MCRSRMCVFTALALIIVAGCFSAPPAQANGFFGAASPPMVQVGANQLVGVTYFIQNPSTSDVTFVSSVADFTVNGGITSVNLPVSLTVHAGSMATLASNVSISEALVLAAKAAGTDMIQMVRTFDDTSGTIHVSIPIYIKVGSSMIGPASVTEIILDTPQDSGSVAQFGELRGHAFIRGTGTGSITGEWLVDGSPVETFNSNMLGGVPIEVSSRESLTTRDLGEHEVELRITSPGPVTSPARRYVVVPTEASNQRVLLVSPRDDAGIAPDLARVAFRWTPMPGAARYEIAFSPILDPLGLDAKGNVKRGLFKPLEWTPTLESFGQLMLLVTVPGDTVAWTPNPVQHARIFGLTNTMCWAVRAVYPGQEHGDPSTTSNPGRLVLIPAAVKLNLSAPENGITLPSAFPTFKWQAGPGGSMYEITLTSGGKTVFSAMTPQTQYALDDLMTFRLAAGSYSWRVRAIRPGAGVTAISENRAFSLAEGTAALPNTGTLVRPENAILQVASTMPFVPLPNAGAEIAITPADGSKIASQMPGITATYPAVPPGNVRLILDGVDVTGLAEIGGTSLKLTAPWPLAPGAHSADLTIVTAKNDRLQSTSRFTVELARGWKAATSPPDEPDTEANQQGLPMRFRMDSRWEGTDRLATTDALNVDASIRGQKKWAGNPNSYTAANFQLSRPAGRDLDLTGFIVGAGINNDRFKVRAGDIGDDESLCTVNGLATRAFNFSTTAGPIKLSAMQTLGDEINQSNIGRAPRLFLITVQPAGATEDRGLKLIYADSKDEFNGDNSGFAGPTRSSVLSLTGKLPLGGTGAALNGEFANSNGTFESAFGKHSANGTAMSFGLGGRVRGFDVAGGYRSIGSEFVSPASTTLATNLRGWEFSAGRQLGRFVKSKLSYITLENTGGEQIPGSSISSQGLDLNIDFPKLPSITARVAKNRTSSKALGRTTLPSSNEENVWSITASYGGAKCNGYLGYAKSDLGDKYDSRNLQRYPGTYVPNARSSGTWTGSLSYQLSGMLRVRTYYGSTGTDRWVRNVIGTNNAVFQGTDSTRQLRVEAEFRPAGNLSATMGWTKGKSNDALGLYGVDQAGFDTKLNYRLPRSGGTNGFIVTAGWRRLDSGGSVVSIMLNDSRLLSSGL